MRVRPHKYLHRLQKEKDNTYAFNNNQSLHLSGSLCILPLCVHVIAFMNSLRCFLFGNDVNVCLLKHIK